MLAPPRCTACVPTPHPITTCARCVSGFSTSGCDQRLPDAGRCPAALDWRSPHCTDIPRRNNRAGLRLEPEMQQFETVFDFSQGTMGRPGHQYDMTVSVSRCEVSSTQ
jgi:hypothetical protein